MLALLASCALTGCYSMHRVEVTPVPISLVSPPLFVLHPSAAATADSARTSCLATRVEGTVREVRGDTLYLRYARILAGPRGYAPCQ